MRARTRQPYHLIVDLVNANWMASGAVYAVFGLIGLPAREPFSTEEWPSAVHASASLALACRPPRAGSALCTLNRVLEVSTYIESNSKEVSTSCGLAWLDSFACIGVPARLGLLRYAGISRSIDWPHSCTAATRQAL